MWSMLKQKTGNAREIIVYGFFRTDLIAITHFHLLSFQFNTVICNDIKLSYQIIRGYQNWQDRLYQISWKENMTSTMRFHAREFFLDLRLVNHCIAFIKLYQDLLEETVTLSSSRYPKKHLSKSCKRREDAFPLLSLSYLSWKGKISILPTKLS